MPRVEYCRLEFLQQLFQGKKQVLLNHQVSQFTEPTAPELAVKLLFPQLSDDEELMSYFDTDQGSKGKFPERRFFWGILFNVRKQFAD